MDGGKQRVLYFDHLRIWATLGVMILHIAGQNWGNAGAESLSWQTFNLLNSCTRWSVPIFVMISGALFLGRPCSMGKLFKKHILRIATAFVFWSALYGLAAWCRGAGGENVLMQILKGHYHMWFLFVIAGLYLIVPLAKKITESPGLTKYFLVLMLVFCGAIPQLLKAVSAASPAFGDALQRDLQFLNMQLPAGYAGYFVLGYFLSVTDLSPKIRRLIYALGILGFLITAGGTALISWRAGSPQDMLYSYFSVNVLLESAALFVFFKYRIRPGNKPAVTKISQYTFGAYLVHPLILELLDEGLGFNTLTYPPILSVPGLILAVFLGSFAISWVCNHIPFLKKYIV